ncbi:kinesin-like protein KIN-UC isoform X2 [Coffea eugenioides]|uniref:kinesin-like protein KIN-UC isoform X2 n=1 Tax=Coffea eugenioides TaxID=49369 RepID=UPI000F6056EE|nr:kinesin-like protein KIN-UC isoform X2 [Coffea eugenioides]
MASSSSTAASVGRPSSSHRSERPPLSASASASASAYAASNVNSSRSSRSSIPTSLSSSTNGIPTSRRSRSLTPSSRTRSPSPSPSSSSYLSNDPEPGRVRVAVRLRPRIAADLSDADYPDCVEVQPELKKLKLRKNNWSAEYFRFDEVFATSASQKRVYEVVAKPVVESVLDGYNGTVMAYGQTGTGKTYTLGRMGKDDDSKRGIMVRALEDITANTSPTSDCVEISYLQLYMESIQDLLAPEKTNIPIVEDGRTGEVSVPGATVVKINSMDQFVQLLHMGEANRHAANTKLNTESSRSHAILMVFIRRSVREQEGLDISLRETEIDKKTGRPGYHVPTIRKSKLLIVDLAGSERLDKSGSEGHLREEAKFINLSLTSLGKCINALAENSPHIPTRDSKLTRLLRDSFGGSARTSLIVTIGPSSRHHAETSSTIMFGQRAMKIVNAVKLKEEFDYESLCRKLEIQVDHLTEEVDKQQKLRENCRSEMEIKLREYQNSFAEAEKSLVSRSEFLEQENASLESRMKDFVKELKSLKDHNDLMHDEIARLEKSMKNNKLLEKENSQLAQKLKDVLDDLSQQKNYNDVMRDEVASLEMSLKLSKQQQLENSTYQKVLADTTQMYEKKIADLMKQSENSHARAESAEGHLEELKKKLTDNQILMQMENSRYQKTLAETTQMYEGKIASLTREINEEHARYIDAEEQLNILRKLSSGQQNSVQILEQKEIRELKSRLQEMHQVHEATVNELQSLKKEHNDLEAEKGRLNDEIHTLRQALKVEEMRRKAAENDLVNIKKVVPESEDGFEEKRSYTKEKLNRGPSSFGQRSSIAKICEEVGLQKILSLLTCEELDVQIHAVKVVANLAAEDSNQERIVHEGGLEALLMLLQSSENTTILRVASGAIANLAMNELNQGLIASKAGVRLLANTATKRDDPQTLRMVAGAIANLCGNESLHVILREDGAIKALVKMARYGNIDVIAQVARGMANFAKCESRGILQGNRRGRSPLMEDNALAWLIANSNTTSSSARRHIELALCHLAQNEYNAKDFVSSGGLKELIRISVESSREDIRNLASKTLKLSSAFQAAVDAL